MLRSTEGEGHEDAVAAAIRLAPSGPMWIKVEGDPQYANRDSGAEAGGGWKRTLGRELATLTFG